MTYPSQQHILLPSNEIRRLVAEASSKFIPRSPILFSNRDQNTLTRNSTGPILDTVSSERPLFVKSVAHRTSSQNTFHQPSGRHPGTFNDLPQGMVNDYITLHEVSAASTGGLPDLQGIIDYSTVELPSPSYCLPDTQDSATVAATSKVSIPVSTPSARSPRNEGPLMQNHTIAPTRGCCLPKSIMSCIWETICARGLSLKSRPSKVEKEFMYIECRVPFTTRKNGIRHARNAKMIHECPTCHETFARIHHRNSHKKFCSGRRRRINGLI
ncbi:hypothetical protein BU17DRAFT_66873 [Hysterangium stoloniferum]|nr:hypothetical protein BU17DRAFT_66873 [Hysterangium stoloniferum]